MNKTVNAIFLGIGKATIILVLFGLGVFISTKNEFLAGLYAVFAFFIFIYLIIIED